tara:strand:+ start:480 stop:1697 length:1218 start_codon:yes stop_codon:yes gene_type:complete
MAITNEKEGVWSINQIYAKQNQGSIWDYDGVGQLWAWGDNSNGKLGLNQGPGQLVRISSPVQVPGTNWQSLSQTYHAVSAIKSDGTAWMWGSADGHTLCQNNPDNSRRSSPVQVGSSTIWNKTGQAEGQTVYFTKTDGTLWSCGKNDFGQLGQNDRTTRSSPVQVPGTTWDQPMSSAMGTIYCTKTDGTLWAWGANQFGSVGINKGADGRRSSPVQIDGSNWSKLASSSRQTMAIKTDGTLWGWGNNHSGCLGLANHPEGDFRPHQKSISSPSQVPGTTWSDIGCAHFNSAATKTDGTLWAWGKNQYGELGQNNRTSQSSPVQIPGTSWKTVRGGAQGLMFATKTDGTLWAWGRNYLGSLGLNQSAGPGTQNSRSSPVQVGSDTSWNLAGVQWGNNSSVPILKNV